MLQQQVRNFNSEGLVWARSCSSQQLAQGFQQLGEGLESERSSHVANCAVDTCTGTIRLHRQWIGRVCCAGLLGEMIMSHRPSILKRPLRQNGNLANVENMEKEFEKEQVPFASLLI